MKERYLSWPKGMPTEAGGGGRKRAGDFFRCKKKNRLEVLKCWRQSKSSWRKSREEGSLSKAALPSSSVNRSRP